MDRITTADRIAVLEVFAFADGRYDKTAALDVASEVLRAGHRELSVLEAYRLTEEILAGGNSGVLPKNRAA